MADKTLAGRPIEGEISRYSDHAVVEQWDEEKFLELLDAVLDVPGVEAVRWHQYTPYFNDGDPCYFHTWGVGVKVAGGDPEAGEYEDGFVDIYEIRPEGDWTGNYPDRKFVPSKEPSPVFRAFEPFNRAVESGHFDNVLNKAFGDPAEVTATKEGFSVEFYDHD